MSEKYFVLLGVLIAALAISACGGTSAAVEEVAAPAAASEAVLKLSGLAEATWSASDLQALPQSEAEYTNKDGETKTYSGVAFSELFTATGVSEYVTATLVASDGYTAEVAFDELSNCPNCLVAFQDDGTLRSVMPDLASNVQVKGLVEIQVQ